MRRMNTSNNLLIYQQNNIFNTYKFSSNFKVWMVLTTLKLKPLQPVQLYDLRLCTRMSTQGPK